MKEREVRVSEAFGAEEAEALLREWTANPSLVKHGLAVARCLAAAVERVAEAACEESERWTRAQARRPPSTTTRATPTAIRAYW